MSDTIRGLVAEQIATDNTDFIVLPYGASAPDNLGAGKSWVSVYRTDVKPHTLANVLTHSITIDCITGATHAEAAEDAADDVLYGVLFSLQRIDEVEFVSATRTVFDEKFLGYQILCEVHAANIFRSTVLEERN